MAAHHWQLNLSEHSSPREVYYQSHRKWSLGLNWMLIGFACPSTTWRLPKMQNTVQVSVVCCSIIICDYTRALQHYKHCRRNCLAQGKNGPVSWFIIFTFPYLCCLLYILLLLHLSWNTQLYESVCVCLL